MKEKIRELIQHHKEAKLEVSELIKELNQLKEKEADCEKLIEKYSEEYAWRGVFINQLEDLL